MLGDKSDDILHLSQSSHGEKALALCISAETETVGNMDGSYVCF